MPPRNPDPTFMREVRKVWLKLIHCKTKKATEDFYHRLVEQARMSTPSGQIAAKVLRDLLTDEDDLEKLFGVAHDSMKDEDIADVILLRKAYIDYLRDHRKKK